MSAVEFWSQISRVSDDGRRKQTEVVRREPSDQIGIGLREVGREEPGTGQTTIKGGFFCEEV
jgi:hypothetical protein